MPTLTHKACLHGDSVYKRDVSAYDLSDKATLPLLLNQTSGPQSYNCMYLIAESNCGKLTAFRCLQNAATICMPGPAAPLRVSCYPVQAH